MGILIITLCALQVVLMCILLIERRKRLQTESTVAQKTAEKQRLEGELEQSRSFIKTMADTMASVLFVYDLVERRNVYVNERSSKVLGYSAQEVIDMGDTFLTKLMHPDDLASLNELNHRYQNRPNGTVFENVFRFKHKNGEWRTVHRLATVFLTAADGRPTQLIGTATDITDVQRGREQMEQLSSRLFTVLDVERRRIAQELHDTAAQNLFAVSLNLTKIQTDTALSPKVNEALEECQKLCDEALDELRTLSFMLYPPMLDKAGLSSALLWYVEGLKKRAGIDVQLETAALADRLPLSVERDLFRIAQEALANVVRHSGSKRAVVQFEMRGPQAVLKIVDFGKGIRQTTSTEDPNTDVEGVGIRSMRERVRTIGGTLEILSGNQGTTVTATVPVLGDGSS
jgi:PAS domain S-box-containing protein